MDMAIAVGMTAYNPNYVRNVFVGNVRRTIATCII